MNSTTGLLVTATLVGASLFCCRPPSLESIRKQLSFDPEGRFIQCGDLRLDTQWGDETSFTGLVRDVEQAYYEGVPAISHNVLVTSGDFSDPEIVDFSRFRNGALSWRAQVQPEGSVHVLHLIADDPATFEQLQDLDIGDQVTISGREERDGKIENSNGGWQGFGRTHGHVLLLASDVTQQPRPQPRVSRDSLVRPGAVSSR